MAQQIRFRIHTTPEEVPEPPRGTIPFGNNQTDALFAMMGIASILGPSLSINPTELAMRNMQNYELQEALIRSEENQQLQRNNSINIIVSSERYDAADKKFDSCPICTDPFEDNTAVSVLKCTHIYHTKCIKEWGHYNPKCPVCKANIPQY